MIGAVRAACVAGWIMTAGGASAEATYEILSFDDLDGWTEDDHSAALSTFRNTCMDRSSASEYPSGSRRDDA